jgi:hypothetical protein
MSRLYARSLLIVFIGSHAWACAPSDQADPGALGTAVEREDSAGVEVVKIPRSVIGDLPVWTLSVEPVFSVGQTSGDPDQVFGRVLSAIRLDNTDIVVAEGQTLVLRRFSSEGEFLGRFGGLGSGPGEFRAIDRMRRLHGGQLGVLDAHERRASVFDSDGSFLRTLPAPCGSGGAMPRGDPAPCYAVDLLGDGTILSNATRRAGPTGGPVENDFRHGPSGTVLLALASGDVIQVVDSVPAAGRAHIAAELGGSRALWSTKELFDPDGRWTATPSGIVVGAGDRYELRYYGADGHLARAVRLLGELERSTPGHLEAISTWAETIESPLALEFTKRYLETVEVGRPLPPFGELRSDGAGLIWAADYFPPTPLGPQEPVLWTVFAEDGLPMARIETGRPWDLLDIGADYVLVREADSLGVERVTMYSILRSGVAAGS